MSWTGRFLHVLEKHGSLHSLSSGWLRTVAGEWTMVEDAIPKAQLCTHTYSYGDDAESNESSARFRHRLEDFEVVRLSRKKISLLSLGTLRAVFDSGIQVDASRFTIVPRCIRDGAVVQRTGEICVTRHSDG